MSHAGGDWLLTQHFRRVRPYLYHLTDRSNLDHMREMGKLFPAAALFEQDGRIDLLRVRRAKHIELRVGPRRILIRDQAPLHRGNLSLANGYSFEEFIESLNRRIFFWPGSSRGPISYGVRHFDRYQRELPVIVRIGFDSLVLANPGAEPRYCGYNSGSPRCSNGVKSPRGPETFLSAAEFRRTPSQVVEVTFDGSITLPTDAQFGTTPAGPWRPL